ncbi:MAG: Gfo/Idh/MocA family oxidoreductase [Campylobacterales bacterium]|nr:Gfo/Idh/MocA family oxidoreductase [Campylobacterales bacterium]NQY19978.1 Gfo/Idh/MocA family oxidoreductase [Campylobacteraceae bacterium]NQY52547.1 Gfo/Idh/MocA family oxidoreductase [Campylobacteraceae bacterium]
MKELGIGVIGMGWMGEAHSNAYNSIQAKFSQINVKPNLIICSEIIEERAKAAKERFGFEKYTTDWKKVVEDPAVDIVDITAPNSLHLEMIKYCIKHKKHINCEKPVGAFPDDTIKAYELVKDYEKETFVGYNYRWSPLVQEAKKLIEEGTLGELRHFRGRFFSCYAADELGFYSWRFEKENGHGALTDIMSHAVDMAINLMGEVKEVQGVMDTFIKERPIAPAGASHYAKGSKDDEMKAVTNDDYVNAIVKFKNGARGYIDSSRAFYGPTSEMTFEVHGSKGSIKWNFEEMNTMHLYTHDENGKNGYKKIYSSPEYSNHGNFNPSDGSGLGYEDLKAIEVSNFLNVIANKDNSKKVNFEDAKNVALVLNAIIESNENKTVVNL